jgi:hypothetical protein
MCKRTTADPLLRTLLDQYRVHPLLVPREHVSIGDVCVSDGRTAAATTKLAVILDPIPALPEPVTDERMADVSSIRSGTFDFAAGMRFLAGFLQQLPGLASLAPRVRATYEAASTVALDFMLRDLTRDSIDLGAFTVSLVPCQLRTAATFWTGRDRLYPVTAIWRARSVTVRAKSRGGQAAEVRADAIGVAHGGASVAADRNEGGTISYIGDRSLAVGVEVVELVRDPHGRRVHVKTSVRSLGPVRGDTTPAGELPAFIGGDAEEGGDVFLALAKTETAPEP